MLTFYIMGCAYLILRACYKYGEESDEDFDSTNKLGSRIGAAFIWPILAAPYIAFKLGEREKSKSVLPEAKVLPRLK